MKKITLLLAVMALVWAGTVQAATIKNPLTTQNFNGLSELPTGWSAANNANYSLYGIGGWYNLTTPANKLNVATGNSSKNQGVKISFPTTGSETEVFVEFDWTITTATVGHKNALGLLLKDNVAAAYTNTGDILTLYCSGTDGMIHCQNIDNTTAVFQDLSGSGSFLKSGTNAATCNANNASTITTCGWALGNTIHIKATLDFVSKKVTYLKLSNSTTNLTSYENTTGLDFLSNTAANLSKVCITNTRISASGNGSNAASNTAIDNFETYTMIEANVANATINYLDPTDNLIKYVTITDKIIGSTYTASSSDIATFILDNYFYSYDANSTTADNVVILTNGSAIINLKFSKTAVTAGPYTWTGTTNSNWNDFDANFTTTGSNSLGYQNGNSIVFPSNATNKTVNLNANLNSEANDINLAGDLYSLSGPGSITGTGKLVLNTMTTETVNLGIKINLTGGITLSGGSAILTNDLGSATYSLGNDAKLILQTGAEFTKPIITTGSSVSIQTNSNVFYSPAITGTASTIDLILGVSGNISGGVNWSSKFLSTMPANAQVNVTTNQPSAGYGVAAGSLTSNKVNLGDNVRLLHNYNPNAGGTTVIAIGELTGASSASVEGGWVDSSDRGLSYAIGALNTDATYNGVFKNYGTIIAAPLNIMKKGTGIWTLTAANPDWILGAMNVDGGKLVMNGSIASTTVTSTIAAGATLSGTGSIAGATVVNGTLEGSLSFGSNLTLAGTTKLVVGGFGEGEYNVINVTGTATFGGVLNIEVNAAVPASGTTIKLVNAATYAGEFTQPITAPEGYSFNKETGELTYAGSTGLNENSKSVIKVYLVNDNAVIDGLVAGENFTVYNALGAIVKTEKATATKTIIALPTSGLYIVKASGQSFKLIK